MSLFFVFVSGKDLCDKPNYIMALNQFNGWYGPVGIFTYTPRATSIVLVRPLADVGGQRSDWVGGLGAGAPVLC